MAKPSSVPPSRGAATADAPAGGIERPAGAITADLRRPVPPGRASATTPPTSPAGHHDLRGRAVSTSSPPAHTEIPHSDDAPTGEAVGLDGLPVGSPSRGGPDEDMDVTEGAAIPLPPPHDHLRRPTDGVIQPQSAIDDSAKRCGSDGRWLPLREAVRELGSLDALSGIARDGTLQLREDDQHGVEVWVAGRDRLEDAPTQLLAVPTAAATVSNAPQPSGLAAQIGILLASLTESHERSLQLARENGALSERVPAFERELKAARESAASSELALEAMRERLGAAIETNLALATMLEDRSPDSEPEPAPPGVRARWQWLLIVTICITSAPIVVWLIEWGHHLGG